MSKLVIKKQDVTTVEFKFNKNVEMVVHKVKTKIEFCDVKGCSTIVEYAVYDFPEELNESKFNSRVCEKHIENIGELSTSKSWNNILKRSKEIV